MYYVISAGTQYGPYPVDKIGRLLAAGQLKAEDIAWAEGMSKKMRLYAIPGIKLPAGSPYLARQASEAPPPDGDYDRPSDDDHVAPVRPSRNSGIATGSFLLGVLALTFASSIYHRTFPIAISVYTGLGAGLVAIVLGHLARRGIKRSQGRSGGAGTALAGLICGYIAIAPSLLTVISAYGYRSVTNSGRIAIAEAKIKEIVGYIDWYTAKNDRRPPSMAAGLRDLVTQRMIVDESLLTDPWGEPVQYKIPAVRSGTKFDVWSNGPDHISGTEDDIGNWKP